MINFNKLQNKSEAQKAFYASTISIIIIGLLFVIWGYNFVNGNKVVNIAGSANDVVDIVDSIKFNDNFNKALSEMSQLFDESKSTLNKENIDKGVSSKYTDTFNNNDIVVPNYGDNPADVLY